MSDPRNLFHRGSLLNRPYDDALREIALLMHGKGKLRDTRTRLLNLAADILLIVDTIDEADDHIRGVLLPNIPD